MSSQELDNKKEIIRHLVKESLNDAFIETITDRILLLLNNRMGINSTYIFEENSDDTFTDNNNISQLNITEETNKKKPGRKKHDPQELQQKRLEYARVYRQKQKELKENGQVPKTGRILLSEEESKIRKNESYKNYRKKKDEYVKSLEEKIDQITK